MNAVTECIYCNSKISQHWDTVNIWKCASCGLYFRNPFPTPEDVSHLYEQAWCHPEKHESETGATAIELGRRYARKLAAELNRTNFGGLRILEFGAGTGTMMAALKELGAEVYGVEPFGYEYLKKQGFTIFRTLDQIPKSLFFDGIITIQVMEHLVKPWNTMKNFRELLKESGWLYISTLNMNGLNAQLCRAHWREVRKSGHLIFFTSRNLESILSQTGFTRHKRLRWFIQYNNSPLRRLINIVLQMFLLDGELRYLAWRPN